MGGISGILTIWDYYNCTVIERMGMAWDTGAPVWPFQTPDILLHVLNGPALLLTFGLVSPKQHLIWYPAAVLMWWSIGKIVDRKRIQSPRNWFVFRIIFPLIALCLIWFAASMLISTYEWWGRHGREFSLSNSLLVLKFATPTLWCLGIASFALWSAVGAWRGDRGLSVASQRQ